jgi:hypothetical protein
MRFDQFTLLVRLRGIIWDDRGAEISVVDRVMYRDGKFKASLVSKERTCDTSPHRLRDFEAHEKENRMKEGEDIRSSC